MLENLPERALFELILVCTEYRIRSIQVPIEPSSRTSQACEWCSEEEGQLAQQWGALGSMGGASSLLPGGLMSPVRDGCIEFLRWLRTC